MPKLPPVEHNAEAILSLSDHIRQSADFACNELKLAAKAYKAANLRYPIKVDGLVGVGEGLVAIKKVARNIRSAVEDLIDEETIKSVTARPHKPGRRKTR